jgi:hypothetical protein
MAAKIPDIPSIIIGVLGLALIVVLTLTAGSAELALVIGGASVTGFVVGGLVFWRYGHDAVLLWGGALLIVFGLLFALTFLYGELWVLAGLVVFGTGLGVFTRRWLVARGGKTYG